MIFILEIEFFILYRDIEELKCMMSKQNLKLKSKFEVVVFNMIFSIFVG